MNFEGLMTPKGFFRHFARNLPRLPLHFYAASVYFLSVLSTFRLFELFERRHLIGKHRRGGGTISVFRLRPEAARILSENALSVVSLEYSVDERRSETACSHNSKVHEKDP